MIASTCAPDLSIDLAKAPLGSDAVGVRLLQPLALGIVGIDITGNQRGVSEVLTQSLDRERFNVVQVDAAAILAQRRFRSSATMVSNRPASAERINA